MESVLVLGGTGFVGRAFCAQWTSWHVGGPRLTVVTRRPSHARDEWPLPLVDVVVADVHEDAQLAPLVRSHDAVVNLVGILHGTPAQFERVHAALPRRIAAAGARRVVHVSALGAGANAPSHYLRSKQAGEEALRGAPGVALTVLRPSVMFGEGDHFLNLFARLQRVFPVMPLAGADARFQPVWVDDTARALVQCLLRPEAAGQAYEAVGPQAYTLRELVQCAGRWAGHPRPVLALPDALGRLQAALMGLLPGPPLISSDNLDSMKIASVATGQAPTLEALGVHPAALAAIAPAYLSPDGRLDRWRAAPH